MLSACATVTAPALTTTVPSPHGVGAPMTLTTTPESPDDPPMPAPTARVTADVLVHPRTGTVTTTMHFEGAPRLFLLLVLAGRSVRCAEGLAPDTCDARPVSLPPELGLDPDDTRRLWAIHGDTPTVTIEGVVSEDTHEVGMNGLPDYAATDLVELRAPALLPTPLSFALDHVTLECSFRVDGEPSVSWPSSLYDGPFAALDLTAMASAALTTEHVACGELDAIDVSYDEDFPGRERAMDLAALACDGLARMRARWGEPDGDGAFRLWLSPRRGLGYYLQDRTLVVPAYYGWTERPDGASWSTHEETDSERMLTDLALLHELSHTWFSRSPSPRWRGLHEGIAAYAALSTLVAAGRASWGAPSSVTDEILAGRGSTDGLDDYTVGNLFLDAIEHERGVSALDEVLRALRSGETRSDEEIEAFVGERLGALGTRWLNAARGP